VIFKKSLTLNFQQPKVYKYDKKISKKPVTFVKGRPKTSDEHFEQIQQSFIRSVQKSFRRASEKLLISQTTVWRV
jgi:hypothetical protein